jgi:hypothetical protein
VGGCVMWWMGCAQHINESLRKILCFMCVTISNDSKHQTEMGSQPHHHKTGRRERRGRNADRTAARAGPSLHRQATRVRLCVMQKVPTLKLIAKVPTSQVLVLLDVRELEQCVGALTPKISACGLFCSLINQSIISAWGPTAASGG